jgi:hypothetical protein
MRIISGHIVPFVTLIALFGLGETPVFTSSVINQSVTTELITRTNIKVSKSINYFKSFRQLKTTFSASFITPELSEPVDLGHTIIISIQSATFHEIKSLIQKASGLFFHRLTIDHNKQSAFKAEFPLSQYPVPGTINDYRTFMWNSMLNEKCLSLIRKDSSCSIYLNEQSKQSGVGFI